MYRIKNKVKGITLVSLVVTIIVLLILAGVAINFSIGDGGILKRAEDAASKYKEASIKEVIDIYKLNETMGGEETLKEYLIENGIISEEEIEEEGLIKLSENIYGISTYEDLKYLSESVNKGEEYRGKTIYILNDIDCRAEYNEETGELISGENFVPIGSSNTSIENEENSGTDKKEFNGKLEGIGYKIENIYIKKNEEESYCTGLIGYLGEEGEIRDLSIEKSYIQGYYETGAIVGRNRGKIINCINESKVIGDYYLTGGIAGRNANTIENCINRGTVYGGVQTGGIVGNCDFSSNVTVINCYNYGNIDASGIIIGGVIGGAYSASDGIKVKIENCYNEGEIGSSKNYEKYEVIGGVIGQAWDSKDINCYDITINNCKNKGEVSGYRYIGGIVGILDNCNINNSYNTGRVNAIYSHVGGITGYNIDSAIKRCSNSGYIYLSEEGSYGAGGIAGVIIMENYDTVLEECYNTGEVYSLASLENGKQTGGIAGNVDYNREGKVTEENKNNIINCYNTGYIHGIEAVGGIIGFANRINIANCYNVGNINDEKSQDEGGIISYLSGDKNNVENNFWLETCGASFGISNVSSNNGAEIKTEEEIKNMVSILSDKYVQDSDNVNNGYPILKWQK